MSTRLDQLFENMSLCWLAGCGGVAIAQAARPGYTVTVAVADSYHYWTRERDDLASHVDLTPLLAPFQLQKGH